MIQRFIYDVLLDGVAQITADTSLLDFTFDDVFGLVEEERTAIKDYWESKPPEVRHGYAPRDVAVPVYSIILENETESQTWIHNDVGQITDVDDENYRADCYGSIWRHQYGILVFTEHPDVTTYYYEIAKTILLGANDYFTQQGLFDIDISGADLMPDPRYIPEHLFARKVTFACQREFTRVDRDSATGKFTTIDGIHIDRSGSPRDAGAVKTNVTVEDGES